MILARAAYARDESDIYLLDNPTSALDQKVAQHIFKCLVLDSLKNKHLNMAPGCFFGTCHTILGICGFKIIHLVEPENFPAQMDSF